MSIATEILKSSGALANVVHGEQVTFRGETLVCLIDRTLAAEGLDVGELDLQPSESSYVWILKSSLKLPPANEEWLLDELGKYHAIRHVATDPVYYKCRCEITDRQ